MTAAERLREALMPVAQALGATGRAFNVIEAANGSPNFEITYGHAPAGGAARVMTLTTLASLRSQLVAWALIGPVFVSDDGKSTPSRIGRDLDEALQRAAATSE